MLFAGEEMIFRAVLTSLGVNDIYVAVEVGGVFVVYLALSFGNVELLGCIAWVEDTELLTVGGYDGHIMAALCEKAELTLFGNSDVNNDLTAVLQMADRFIKITCI